MVNGVESKESDNADGKYCTDCDKESVDELKCCLTCGKRGACFACSILRHLTYI